MKAYLIATDEPLASKMDTMDEHGNPLADSLSLYLNRADAERAVDDYSKEILGEAAWIVEVEITESYGN
jgi:hypothetical protein